MISLAHRLHSSIGVIWIHRRYRSLIHTRCIGTYCEWDYEVGFIISDTIDARIRAYVPRWATPRTNAVPRRCVLKYKYEYAGVITMSSISVSWMWPLQTHRLNEISTPILKVQLAWTLGRTYARMSAYTHVKWHQQVCIHLEAPVSKHFHKSVKNFIPEFAFYYMFCKMPDILPRSQYVQSSFCQVTLLRLFHSTEKQTNRKSSQMVNAIFSAILISY